MKDRNSLLQEAQALIKLNSIYAGRRILREILKTNPNDGVALADMAMCDLLEGRITEAIETLNFALEVDPKNEAARTNLQFAISQKPVVKNATIGNQDALKITNVQIELAGTCSAECEFCDWVRRPEEQKKFMDTVLAKKCIAEARQLGAQQISFHITGESLHHPDILEILPRDYPILISTNCLPLRGEIARELASMNNLTIILAVLWPEPEKKRLTSILNAVNYLKLNPVNRLVVVQMICSENSVPWAQFMYNYFSPFLAKVPQLQLHFKQPYTQEVERPTLGYIPEDIPESVRVQVDRMPTPQSCGPDCVAFSPNPSTDILIQSDGQIKPCFKRSPDWGIGYAQSLSLDVAWRSNRFKEIRTIWSKGDPDNQLPCHDCIRMAVPRGKAVWWDGENKNLPPSALNDDQIQRSTDPVPYPKIIDIIPIE